MYKSLALAALSALPAFATPAVNVYFGQGGVDSLASYCKQDGFEYITLSFVNNSPEQDTSGLNYPGTNFGAHCAGTVYVNSANGKSSKLLSQCTYLAEDIPVCQALGKKVLLSVGGAWIDGTDYTVTGVTRGQEFAQFLWGAFGPYDSTWSGPRPFDFNGKHVSVDGFDFDIEHGFSDQTGYLTLLSTLRSLMGTGKYLITGAPQCPLSNNDMGEMISKVAFDILFIQFYNNPVCDGIPGNTPGDSFNFNQWVTFIGQGASKNAKLFIGLQGAPAIAGSGETGYLEPAAAISLISQYKTNPSFGGVMIWDVYSASALTTGGRTYYQAIHDAVVGAPATTTTATTTTTSAAPSGTPSCGATHTVQLGDTLWQIATDNGLTLDALEALNPDLNPDLILVGDKIKLQAACPSSSTTSSVTSTTTTTSSSSSTTTTSSTSTSTTSSSSSSTTTTSSTSTSTTSSSSSSTTTTSSTSTSTTSSSSSSTTTTSSTSTSTTPSSTSSSTSSTSSSSAGLPPSSSLPGTGASTTTATGTTTTSKPWSNSTVTSTTSSTSDQPSGPSGGSSTSEPTSWTTSTVSRTITRTVTSCAPTVTDCPNRPHVTTEVVPWYTTVCPVTETQKPTTTTTDIPLTTSTVYTTKVYTVTKCPDTVPNCPNKGSVTTEVIPLYTTVCPVTEVQTTPAGPKVTGPPVVVGAECPGGAKCPGEGEKTTVTKITSYSTILTTLAKPTTQYGHGNSTVPTGTGKVSSTANPTKPGGSSTTPASGCNGANCPKPSTTQVVTAGAGRAATALGLPVAIAALFLVL